jgi:DNA-binding protein H-NS
MSVDGNKHARVFQVLNQQVENAATASPKPIPANGTMILKRCAPPVCVITSEQRRSSISEPVSATNAVHDTTRRQIGNNRTALSKKDDNHAAKVRTRDTARRRSAIICGYIWRNNKAIEFTGRGRTPFTRRRIKLVEERAVPRSAAMSWVLPLY